MNYRDTKRRNWAIFWNSSRSLNYMYDDFVWLMLLKARNLICRFFHIARKSTTQGFYSNKNRHEIIPKYVSFKKKTQNKIWKLSCYVEIRARVLYVPKLYIHIRRKIKNPTKFVQCCNVRWNRNFAKSRWTRSKTRHFRLRWGDRRPPETSLRFQISSELFRWLVNFLEARECVYLSTRFTLIVVACLSKIVYAPRKENDSRDKR